MALSLSLPKKKLPNAWVGLLILGIGLLFMTAHSVKDFPSYAEAAWVSWQIQHPTDYQPKSYDALLHKYVHGAFVDYKSLKKSHDIDKVADELARTSPDKLPDDSSKLAFWVNAYNALVVKAIVDHYPITNIKQLGSYASQQFVVGGQPLSIQDVFENKIVPLLKDNQILGVFLCCGGSQGYPQLEDHAYTAPELGRDIVVAVYRFMNDPRNVLFQKEHRVFALSQFFEWNSSLFEAKAPSVHEFANMLLPPDKQFDMVNDVTLSKRFLPDFDYRLNDTALSDTALDDGQK